MNRELLKCQFCNAQLNPKNVKKHLWKAHWIDENGINHSIKPHISEPNEVICPVCCGDGGVAGGCYKCDGNGWVSTKSRASYHGSATPSSNADNSRVSNSNYLGENAGAHYRERDGRIGSNPEHDDHSDEATA